MRTTVSIPNPLLARAKREAEHEGLTLSQFIETALRERLSRTPPNPDLAPFRLVTFGHGGLRAGLSFDRLKDLLEDEEIERANRALTGVAAEDADAATRR